VAERQNLGTPIPGTTRVLGIGSLRPFAGYTLDVTVDGMEPPVGDAILCEFNTVGARNASLVILQLLPSTTTGESPMTQDAGMVWRLETERTRFEDDED
jgi:hypothetical protein